VPPEPPALTADELAKFAGEFYSVELDASYRFAVVDDGLAVRIEQEPPIPAMPVAEDSFEFRFKPRGWWESQVVSLEFERDEVGAVTGFALGAGSERDITFERR
jgi:hypothetical protein